MIGSDALQTVIQTGVQTVFKPASNPLQTGVHTHPHNPSGSEGGFGAPLDPERVRLDGYAAALAMEATTCSRSSASCQRYYAIRNTDAGRAPPRDISSYPTNFQPCISALCNLAP